MTAYRILVADLLTNTVREEMPFSTFSYTEALNAPGSFQGTLPLRHPKSTSLNLDAGRMAIYVERDSTLVWGGILWTVDASTADSNITVGAEGFFSHFRKQVLGATHTYTAADQFAIVRNLINIVQALTDGDIGVNAGSATCGVLRDRTYNGFEYKNVGEAIEQLAAVENGFDFAIDVAYESGAIAKNLTLSYPQRGQVTDLVFESGKNLSSVRVTLDAKGQYRTVVALGAGEGTSMLRGIATDTTLAGDYPTATLVTSYKDVSVQATLDAHANADLTAVTSPRLLLTNAVVSGDPALGAWIVGDTVTCRVQDGYLNVLGLFRIIGQQVSVDTEGRETIALTYAEASAF